MSQKVKIYKKKRYKYDLRITIELLIDHILHSGMSHYCQGNQQILIQTLES